MKTLVVIGAINVDLVVRGPRLPEPGRTVVGALGPLRIRVQWPPVDCEWRGVSVLRRWR